MKHFIYTILLSTMLVIVPLKYSVAGENDYIGEISIFAGDFAPRFHVFCEGQVMDISTNKLLFAVLGARYGGDGRTTFALPNLKEAEKSLQGARYVIRLVGIFPHRN